ncbi:hypothetical protein WJX79_006625 [Trebouxia sp. C0005]
MQRPLFTHRHLVRTQVRLGKVSRCRTCPARSLQEPLQSDGSYLTDKAALSDGPDLFMIRTASNLGAMQDSLKGQPSDADIKAMQEVPNRGSAFEVRVRQSWDERKQDKEKWAVYDARRRLEENFSSTDEAADDKY